MNYDPEIYKINDNNCLVDSDCNDIKLECYINDNNSSFCSCTRLYGFTIESKCIEPATLSYVHVAINILTISLFFYASLFGMYLMILHIKKYGLKDSLTKKVSFRPLFYTSIASLFFGYYLIYLVYYALYSDYEIYYTTDGERRNIERGIIGGFGFSIALLALLEIVIVWIYIAIKTKKLALEISLFKTKTTIYVIQSIYALISTVLFALGQVNYAYVLNMLVGVFICCGYLYGSLILKKQLQYVLGFQQNLSQNNTINNNKNNLNDNNNIENRSSTKSALSNLSFKNLKKSKSDGSINKPPPSPSPSSHIPNQNKSNLDVERLFNNIRKASNRTVLFCFIAFLGGCLSIAVSFAWGMSNYKTTPGTTAGTKFLWALFYFATAIVILIQINYISSVFLRNKRNNNLSSPQTENNLLDSSVNNNNSLNTKVKSFTNENVSTSA